METQILDEGLHEERQRVEVRYAGFWIRVAASMIDALVLIPFIALSMYNLYVLKSLTLQIVVTILMMLYKPWLEYEKGATLGKMAVKIHLINNKSDKISLTQSLIRNSPWLLSQTISVFSTVALFMDPNFASATTMMDVGMMQQGGDFSSINLILSLLTLVSCVTVAFTYNKQGLHDMLASTYCVYK